MPTQGPGPFAARCERCGATRPFGETKKERRALRRGGSATAGDYYLDVVPGFACATCGWFAEKLVDEAGLLHKFAGLRHTVVR
ncbi:MAG: hypothetical protein ACT4PT_10260 [Methanobacteriota archaeon]